MHDPEAPFGFMVSFRLSRAETFALLATYESGLLSPEPSLLSDVIAMSSGDSIFVATELLMDPADSRNPLTKVGWIRGNIGKPGIAMLVPPAEPLVKGRETAKWTVVNHHLFNGKLVDNFQGTSMHLSFTEYHQPLSAGKHGIRDTEIYFLEAIVSVHDKGTWIGDTDIVGSVANSKFEIIRRNPLHRHPSPEERSMHMLSVDTWDEFIDYPRSIFIVRAEGNWVARLAATSLSIQRGHRTVVISHDPEIPVCWSCILDRYSLGPAENDLVLIA
jgi:hypothetical protein